MGLACSYAGRLWKHTAARSTREPCPAAPASNFDCPPGRSGFRRLAVEVSPVDRVTNPRREAIESRRAIMGTSPSLVRLLSDGARIDAVKHVGGAAQRREHGSHVG